MDPYGKITTGANDPLASALAKARYLAERDNRKQTIWMTEHGEYRVRPYGESVNPLWTLIVKSATGD